MRLFSDIQSKNSINRRSEDDEEEKPVKILTFQIVERKQKGSEGSREEEQRNQ